MTKIQLTALLQRFMDGTTTVDEEALLADFFRHASDCDRPDDIPEDDWRAYREMFAMFDAEVNVDNTLSDIASADEPLAASSNRVRRWVVGWMAAAAAAALLVVAGLVGRQSSEGSSTGAPQQSVASLQTEADADSIASQSGQPMVKDSVEQRVRKNAAKAHRPYWQPRPPKVYVAEKAETETDVPVAEVDARQIEEAVSQAEILLQAINAHQAAELNRLQSQAMEVFADDRDVDADDYDCE